MEHQAGYQTADPAPISTTADPQKYKRQTISLYQHERPQSIVKEEYIPNRLVHYRLDNGSVEEHDKYIDFKISELFDDFIFCELETLQHTVKMFCESEQSASTSIGFVLGAVLDRLENRLEQARHHILNNVGHIGIAEITSSHSGLKEGTIFDAGMIEEVRPYHDKLKSIVCSEVLP